MAITPWRLAYLGIIFFWVYMTTQLVKRTYFPSDDGLVAISPGQVLQRFAQTGDYINNLVLLRDKQRLGHASIAAKTWEDEQTHQPKGFAIHAGGMVEGTAWSEPGSNLAWSFAGRVDHAQVWHSLDLRVRSPVSSVVMQWEIGQKEPVLEVRKEGKLVADTDSLRNQAKIMSLIPGFSGLGGLSLPQADGSQEVALEKAISLTAKSGSLEIAGQLRQAFILQAGVFGLVESTLTFTEVGELAEVTLPGKYRLVDPIIFGISSAENADKAP